MIGISVHASRDILVKSPGVTVLVLMAFVEIALGQYAVFFGSTPHIMLITAVLMMLYLPGAMSLMAAILAGFTLDLLQSAPLGYSTSMLLLASIIVAIRRPYLIKSEVGVIWYEFMLILAVVQIYCYTVIALWSGEFPSVRPFVFQYGITVLLFPVMNWALVKVMGTNLPEGSS